MAKSGAEKTRDARARKRLIINEIKLQLGCYVCGYTRCAQALNFHHRDPNLKSFEIGTAVGRNIPMEQILEEMQFCEVICANCHMELHHMEVD